MADIRYIDKDFVRFTFSGAGGTEEQATLVFGDKVEVIQEAVSATASSRIKALELFEGTTEGTVRGKPFRGREKGVLKFSMIDVQQGDGMVLETPPDDHDQTKIVFLDGGDNQLFARHVAARFLHRQSSAANPLEVDLILISHGDADHFDGLNDIKRSETDAHLAARKRLFIHPKRVYHHGIVKAPSGLPKNLQLGRSIDVNGATMIVDLFDDPRSAAANMRNEPFERWGQTLTHWETRGPITLRRVAHGMDADELFGFLGPKLKVELHGPFTSPVNDGGTTKPALPFLHQPSDSAVLHLENNTTPSGSTSVSHTINGHSIAFRLTYGNVRFNFLGDLNHESMLTLRNRIPLADLEAEIVKAPHHGAADFDFQALKAMRPVASLISSGDESTAKEYIHPRATLVAALGKVSRTDTAIVLCTELAAFFEKRDYSHRRSQIATFYDGDEAVTISRKDLHKYYAADFRTFDDEKALPSYYGFERTNFGIIHVRTDGERVLVFTHSGKKGMREAYRFTVDANHDIQFAPDVVTG